MEEKQRERRKEMAKNGEEHIPRFFRLGALLFNLFGKEHFPVVHLSATCLPLCMNNIFKDHPSNGVFKRHSSHGYSD